MADMEEDNAYIRRSVVQSVPEEQASEDEIETAKVVAEFPLIEEVIARFKADVIFYKSTDAIPDDALLDETDFMHTVAGNKKAVASIEREIRALEELVETYVKSR